MRKVEGTGSFDGIDWAALEFCGILLENLTTDGGGDLRIFFRMINLSTKYFSNSGENAKSSYCFRRLAIISSRVASD